MPLVDYSSSDEEETQPSQKRKREDESASSSKQSALPPLPSKFHDLYASTVRSSVRDDPALHGGRKRVTPHVEGNWPTHVYIEWYPSPTEHANLSSIIADIASRTKDLEPNEIHSFLTSDLGAALPLHISLSRPIGFLTNQKDAFTSSLEQSIRSSGVRPFNINLATLDWVSNFDQTRWFLVLRVKQPSSDALNKLLHVTNTTVQEYKQSPLYATPSNMRGDGVLKAASPRGKARSGTQRSSKDWSTLQDCSEAFHFSIAWSLKAPRDEVKNVTGEVLEKWKAQLECVRVDIREVKNKVGNVVHSVELVKREIEGGSLFGL